MNQLLGKVGRRARRYRSDFHLNMKTFRWKIKHNNWFFGKLVELSGNRVDWDGITIHCDNPNIATFLKSRFYFRSYERGTIDLVKAHLSPSLPIVEFGGCIGVVSCFANAMLERPEDHVVVEAHPGLIPALEKNRDVNGRGFQIVNAALAYGAEIVSFYINERYFIGNRVQKPGSKGSLVSVPAVSLASLIERFGFGRLNLIVDIEGGEVALVENELPTIIEHVDTIVMEIHPSESWGAGRAAIDTMFNSLREAGFTVRLLDGADVVFTNSRFHPEHLS